MDPIQTLSRIEIIYRQVLDLTLRQETYLQSGDLVALPAMLAQKAQALSEAQRLRALLQTPGVDRTCATFQEALTSVAAVLAELVKTEERCGALSPPPTTVPSRRQVIAAYGGGGDR